MNTTESGHEDRFALLLATSHQLRFGKSESVGNQDPHRHRVVEPGRA